MATARPTRFCRVCFNVPAPKQDEIVRSIMTLAIGAIGAGLARQINLPMFMLTGPAIAVALAGYFGLPVMMAQLMRNIIFLVIGVAIGAGMNAEASAAMLHWPLAFIVLGVALMLIMWLSLVMLQKLFGYDRNTAILASVPGHLSYVMSFGPNAKADMSRVSIVQSVRLLALSFTVPFLAALLGIDTSLAALAPAVPMNSVSFALLLFVSVFVGVGLNALKLPSALLIAGMLVSTFAQVFGLVRGAPSADIMLAGLIAVGALLGCRLSVLRRAALAKGLVAGLATTLLAVAVAGAAAFGAGLMTGQPFLHVLVAFAPGGLETMVAMGAVIGADAGFVAAAHIARLFMLTGLVPLFLGRGPRKQNSPRDAQP